MNWRGGWWLDCAPKVTAVQSSGGAGPAGKYYFEVKLSTTGGFSTSSACFGICNSSVILYETIDANVNIAQANTAGAILLYGDPNGGNNAWGYPTKLNMTGPGTWTLNQVMGVAVDTIAKRLWTKNITAGTPWNGNGGASPDPATGVNGIDFATSDHPVTGNIHAFVGGSNTNPSTYGGATINFGATAFAGTPPTGFSAWGASDFLNPEANSNLTLSGGNLIANAASAIAGANAPMNIVRSFGRKAQA